MKLRLPHPLILLLASVGVAALLTWTLPAGEYDRHEDAATGRTVVVPGTYHRVDPSPVGPLATFVAVPRGLVEAADVVATILFVGGAWVVLDKLGALGRLIAALVAMFHGRGLWAIPLVSCFFALMGAVENMQEEIIPLVPVLLVLGRGLGVTPVVVVAMSCGAAMVGSAFGPTNPFQAGIAMKLAQLPPFSGGGLRVAMLVAAVVLWVGWTMRYAARTRVAAEVPDVSRLGHATSRDVMMLLIMLAPIAAYVVGALWYDWDFNHLSGVFLIAGLAVGLLGGLGLGGTIEAFLEGMQSLVSAAVMVGVARAIFVVLDDGRVIDTILHSLALPLGSVPATAAALLMIPFHVIIHIVVSSVSGHAVLTMPVLVPLSDLLGISRQVTVLAYQTGAGLTELLTPTNGALMAILLAAGVSYGRWFRFAIVGAALCLVVGIAGMVVAMRF